jgi:hypothetical protein
MYSVFILLSSSSYPTRSIIAHATCMWFFFLQGRDMHCERMRAPREIHKSTRLVPFQTLGSKPVSCMRSTSAKAEKEESP